jgi:hypothetical protein
MDASKVDVEPIVDVAVQIKSNMLSIGNMLA